MNKHEQLDLPFGKKPEQNNQELPEGVRFENQKGENVIVISLPSRDVTYAITEYGPVIKRQISETEFVKLSEEENHEAFHKAETAYKIWQENNN